MIENYILSGFFSVVPFPLVAMRFFPKYFAAVPFSTVNATSLFQSPQVSTRLSLLKRTGPRLPIHASKQKGSDFFFFTPGVSGQQPPTTALPVYLLAATMWEVTSTSKKTKDHLRVTTSDITWKAEYNKEEDTRSNNIWKNCNTTRQNFR